MKTAILLVVLLLLSSCEKEENFNCECKYVSIVNEPNNMYEITDSEIINCYRNGERKEVEVNGEFINSELVCHNTPIDYYRTFFGD